MENIQRNLEREIARLRAPKVTKKDRQWTFLLVGDHGEMFSVRWFKSVAITFGFVLVVAVVALVCLWFVYKSAIEERSNLQQTLTDLQQNAAFLQHEKDLLLARLVIAESKVQATPVETQGKQTVQKDAVPIKPVKVAAKNNTLPAQKQPEKKSMPGIPAASSPLEKPQRVAAENFMASYESDSKMLKVQFNIVNTSPDSQPVSGHAFVLLKPDDVQQKKWTVLPSVALISGKPSLIKRGQAFLIARFRNVKFKAQGQTDPNLFKKATVVIYSTDGDLLLEKDFPVKIEEKTVLTTPPAG